MDEGRLGGLPKIPEFPPLTKEDMEEIYFISPGAVDKIKEKSGGDFNLATEAQLGAAGFKKPSTIGLPLLKKGGVFYGSDVSDHAILKE